MGRAVRTIVLLRYLSAPVLRERISRATNKAEAYNGFTKWLHFGSHGYLRSRDPELQEKAIKFLALVASSATTTPPLSTSHPEPTTQPSPLTSPDIPSLGPPAAGAAGAGEDRGGVCPSSAQNHRPASQGHGRAQHPCTPRMLGGSPHRPITHEHQVRQHLPKPGESL
ncbi:hypothetical protein J2Z21_008772 [Streptomyces griseochromogenes]|uniref:Tn3 transposase DDE domain-containing protein n=1 Tax=Streptomyces griseochromogenes TaxID=68214 RepID=A0ABS4M8T2_9ACTN|nr:hypothetical protein [Streptomyces griseochromogenes]